MNIPLHEQNKANVTRYLIGFACGIADSVIKADNVIINSKDVQQRLQDLLNKSAEYRIAISSLKYPGISCYPLVIKLNETETQLVAGFYLEDGTWEESPYTFSLVNTVQ